MKKYINRVVGILNYKIFNSVKKEKNPQIQRDRYESIYKNKSFSSLIRSDSAWYMVEFYLKSGKPSQSFLWAGKSLNLLSSEYRLKRQKNVLEMVVKMAYLQDFVSAEQMAKMYFIKNCDERYELKNDFYNAMVLYALVEGKRLEYVMKNFRYGRKCRIKNDILFANIKVMADFFQEK